MRFDFQSAPGVITPGLLDCLRREFRLDWSGIHGAAHWARVRVNGLRLEMLTGADFKVVEYFAFLHDICRQNEHSDHCHGERAARFASEIRASFIDLGDSQFDLLLEAMAGHTHGTSPGDITIATCWDADRLDLARVGIDPDPGRLCTNPARSPDFILRASENARLWLQGFLHGTTSVENLNQHRYDDKRIYSELTPHSVLAMPITPFHFGPGALIKAVLPASFSWTVFALSNCLIDLEPVGLFLLTGDPAHPWLHTLPGAIAVAGIAATLGRKPCEMALRFWNRQFSYGQARWIGVDATISAAVAWISALIGTLSHLVLDSVMHADVMALWPFTEDNFLRGVVSLNTLHWSCLAAGLLALLFWWFRKAKNHDC